MNSEPPKSVRLELEDQQQIRLLQVARQLVTQAVRGGGDVDEAPDIEDLAAVPVVGAFVTLRKAGELRSCIGNFTDSIQLAEALRRAAIGAATSDPRFAPITPAELSEIVVELSLLHSRQLLGPSPEARRAGIEIGRHGLDLQYAGHKGLLLPQVATEWHWDTEQFLSAVCRKAGVPADTWQNPSADLYRFEATHFGERVG